jgi:biotin carboxylase
MPRILLVAATTGYQTRSFTAAAQRLGIEVTLATDRCHVLEDPWRDHAIPVRFEDPELSAEQLSANQVDGIVAVADRPTLLAALTAQRFGLPFHPPQAVAACRDKHRMRELFSEAGLLVPRYFRADLDADPHILASKTNYPCVLKPLGLSASRGVIRANDPVEFAEAFHRIRHLLIQPELLRTREESNNSIQIEDYIAGHEFALEGIMTKGELAVVAIFDKPDPLEGPYFEETIYVSPSRESAAVQKVIVETTARAVRALGLHHGPIHAEMRVNDAGVWMLEIAARPIGGLCARALRFEGGLNLEDVVVLHAVGRAPAQLRLDPPALGVMMIPVPCAGIYDSVAGIDEARATTNVDNVIITAKRGQKLMPLPEGASYTGFIFASGTDPVTVENALRTAHSRLQFQIFPSLDIIHGRTPDML